MTRSIPIVAHGENYYYQFHMLIPSMKATKYMFFPNMMKRV